MQRVRAVLFCCFAAAVALPVAAQTVGRLKPVSENNPINGTVVFTAVNLAYPATSAGTLTTATVQWAGSGCTAAFKLKFFRRLPGETYTMTAERGPFDVTSGLNTVTLTPPVSVNKEDLIGVTELKFGCGSVVGSATDPNKVTYASVPGDVSSFDLKTATVWRGGEPNARASATAEVFEGVIPVAGAAKGLNNSNFKTSVQITNPRPETISGRLVFHPAGQSASASDPSINYSLTSGKTQLFDDIVTTFGRTGVGSIDLFSTTSFRPVLSVRVFDDRGGVNGTSGFAEEFVNVYDAYRTPEHAFFPIPQSLTDFRQNIGIRSLGDGATLTFSTFTSTGAFLTSIDRDYTPNFFEQLSASAFFGANYVAGGVIKIRVKTGTAIFYVSTTDNRTNDPSAEFNRRE
jgi:hypothetical protein